MSVAAVRRRKADAVCFAEELSRGAGGCTVLLVRTVFAVRDVVAAIDLRDALGTVAARHLPVFAHESTRQPCQHTAARHRWRTETGTD